jgi:hypothetical protein
MWGFPEAERVIGYVSLGKGIDRFVSDCESYNKQLPSKLETRQMQQAYMLHGSGQQEQATRIIQIYVYHYSPYRGTRLHSSRASSKVHR